MRMSLLLNENRKMSGERRTQKKILCSQMGFEPMTARQNVPMGGNFAPFSQLLAAYSTLDFTRCPPAGKRTWHLLPTTPDMLPTTTKHFDRAATTICTLVGCSNH